MSRMSSAIIGALSLAGLTFTGCEDKASVSKSDNTELKGQNLKADTSQVQSKVARRNPAPAWGMGIILDSDTKIDNSNNSAHGGKQTNSSSAAKAPSEAHANLDLEFKYKRDNNH